MNEFLKKNGINLLVGAAMGAAVGSACGAAAGVAGMHQICHDISDNFLVPDSNCEAILRNLDSNAAQVGAGVGGAVGAGIMAIGYSAYKSFCGWAYSRPEPRTQELAQVHPRPPRARV